MSEIEMNIDTTKTELNQVPQHQVRWYQSDIESFMGLKGSRFTNVNQFFSMCIGLIITILFYVCLIPYEGTIFADMFTKRGPTQFATMFFTFWSVAILLLKYNKVYNQRKLLNFEFITSRPDFILGPETVDSVLRNIHNIVDNPNKFILTNRIIIALSNLKNLGRVSDVDDLFRSQGDMDESQMESTYTIVNGFIWAIPVLGFIGTVLGLSEAISSFGNILQGEGGIDEIKSSLRLVTGGLSTAFETTLVSLVAALILQLAVTFLKKKEQDFLDDCSSYCLKRVVNRIRINSLRIEPMIDLPMTGEYAGDGVEGEDMI
jgi:biopolymer transport protein ExbB/TolQ